VMKFWLTPVPLRFASPIVFVPTFAQYSRGAESASAADAPASATKHATAPSRPTHHARHRHASALGACAEFERVLPPLSTATGGAPPIIRPLNQYFALTLTSRSPPIEMPLSPGTRRSVTHVTSATAAASLELSFGPRAVKSVETRRKLRFADSRRRGVAGWGSGRAKGVRLRRHVDQVKERNDTHQIESALRRVAGLTMA
jgi:hypothetical protein